MTRIAMDSESAGLSIAQETLLQRIVNRIRQSLELLEILNETVAEVRAFLDSDRVKIYRFHPDASGEVIAEAINGDRMPSLLGLNFPADDIPPHAREMFVKARQRTIVDLNSRAIGVSIPEYLGEELSPALQEICYRPVDPCHVEYLQAMGVQSSVVVPLLHQDQLWGLLVSHHASPREATPADVQFLQLVADQVGVAIAQASLLAQARQQAEHEKTVNQIAVLLHTQPEIQLQTALEQTVTALQGSGGRLYLHPQDTHPPTPPYVCGEQPGEISGSNPPIEQLSSWQSFFISPPVTTDAGLMWAITDLYQEPQLRTLAARFRSTSIRGMLVIPLQYRQQCLGYLTIFRNAIATEKMWAGQFDPDERQLQPRNSFVAWCEAKQGQAQDWSEGDRALMQAIGEHFAMAVQQHQLYQQVQSFNGVLERQVRERTQELQKASEQQKTLAQVIGKIRASLDLDTIFQATVTEVRQVLDADRVGIFQFLSHSGAKLGEFIAEAVLPAYVTALGATVSDTCFGEQFSMYYQQGRMQALSDIYESGLSQCHVAVLAQFQVRANLIVPLLKGADLWGLLCVHQCDAPRCWEADEIEFVSQVAAQLGVALQQAELLRQTQQQTDTLQQAAEQQHSLFEVVTKIRKSLDVDTIFQTTTQEVCHVMHTDRVAVYRFNEDWGGTFVSNFEAANATVTQSGMLGLNTVWNDTHLQESQGGRYRNNETVAVADIYTAGHADCHVEVLEKFGIRAYAIAPIFVGETLWGLLGIYQHTQPRQWEAHEINFLSQIAAQLGVALHQAHLLTQTQAQAEQLRVTLHDLKQAQTHLIQTEKMSSLGQLVAGVAHEINNPVNFIYGNLNHASDYTQDLLDLLQLYQQYYPVPADEIRDRAEEVDLDFLAEDLPKILSSMKTGADRIRQIVLSLRNFSRFDQADLKAVDIHEGIDSTLMILQHRLKAKPDHPGVEVIRDYGELAPVECHAGQLNQVFMNLISNAIDALEEAHTGQANHLPKLTIQTREENNQIVIRIVDNGTGIPADMRARIFDPFFTTKPIGQGTGLGLSISYQIITERHGGSLECYSQPGEGTEFRIAIPL